MSILTDDNQKKLEKLLVDEKLISKESLDKYRKEAIKLGKPLIAFLLQKKVVSNEALTKAI